MTKEELIVGGLVICNDPSESAYKKVGKIIAYSNLSTSIVVKYKIDSTFYHYMSQLIRVYYNNQ